MQKREKILAAGFGAMLLAYGGNWLFETALEGPLEARHAKTARLEQDIAKREQALSQARKAGKELAVWQSQSLPTDIPTARSQYQAWLLEVVERVGLENPHVDSGEAANRKGLYQSLSFSLRGRGSLAQLTQFLHEFYRAGHLHQIQSLQISPQARRDQLDLSISIDALVLAGADRTDRLTSATSDRLALASLADYQSIVERNLFAAGGPNADAADFAFLTAVLDVDGEPEAWFTLRTTDQILKLRKGQTLDVGQFHGRIAEIADSDVILEADEERWLITVGESLAMASTLPPEF